jgi:hypothetical protein
VVELLDKVLAIPFAQLFYTLVAVLALSVLAFLYILYRHFTRQQDTGLRNGPGWVRRRRFDSARLESKGVGGVEQPSVVHLP